MSLIASCGRYSSSCVDGMSSSITSPGESTRPYGFMVMVDVHVELIERLGNVWKQVDET